MTAVILNAHQHFLAAELAPVIILVLSRHVSGDCLKPHDEGNTFTFDLALFNPALDSEKTGRAKELRALGLEQKHFVIFVAPTVFDFTRPSSGDRAGSRRWPLTS
jgi:hypothetical protein